jgi:diguanylate cyclase (GGDEF)-like protein
MCPKSNPCAVGTHARSRTRREPPERQAGATRAECHVLARRQGKTTVSEDFDRVSYEAGGTIGSSSETPEEKDQRIAGYLAKVARGQPFSYTYNLSNGRAIRVSAGPMPDGGWVDAHEDITHELSLESRIAHWRCMTGSRILPTARSSSSASGKLSHPPRGGETVVVLCLDLDRFKDVNDNFGHATGDALLRGVAERLKSCVRRTDTVARMGGDEFAVLHISKEPRTEATRLSERLIEKICAPYNIDGHHVTIGTSIGIAVSPQDGSDPDKLLKSADVALYRSKSAGRGTYYFYQDEMKYSSRCAPLA